MNNKLANLWPGDTFTADHADELRKLYEEIDSLYDAIEWTLLTGAALKYQRLTPQPNGSRLSVKNDSHTR